MTRYLPSTRLLIIILSIAFGFSACGPQPEQTGEAPPETAAEEALSQEVIAAPDTTGASLWTFLQSTNYQGTWARWPGKGELYAGREPHGMLLTTYLNPMAFGAVNTRAGSMPDGAIVVKENYMPDSTLAAITVMRKVAAYNPEHDDWFFVKYLPSGEIAENPEGVALEGRVASCQACHGQQRDNDYLFTGPIK